MLIMHLKNKYPKRHEFYRHKLNKTLEIKFQKDLCIYEMPSAQFLDCCSNKFLLLGLQMCLPSNFQLGIRL